MAKTICITGATSGIGRATAELFLAEGWQVIATGRRVERLEELRQSYGERLLPLAMDVQDMAAVEKAFAALPAGFKEIDVLLNNAGLALGVSLAQKSLLSDWETMIATNIRGLVACTHAVLPGMVARGHGHVLNIGSIAGSYAYEGGNVYGATKAFVEQFSRNLRCDLHGTGVRVTNIEPGLLETEFTTVRLKGNAKASDDFYAGSEPLVAQDIAEAVFWAVSRPERVNICRIEVMPTCQSNGATRVYKKGK